MTENHQEKITMTPFRLFDSKAKNDYKRKMVNKIICSLSELDTQEAFTPVSEINTDTISAHLHFNDSHWPFH